MNKARLAIRDDAYYVKSPTGAHIMTHQGEVSLTGRSVYQWIDRLVPFLDGRHSLAELTTALTVDRREFVESLVGTLLQRGVVREVSDELPTGIGPAEPPEVRFVGYFRESAERSYQRYRDSVVLVVGSGRLLTAVARAARRSGVHIVHVLDIEEVPGDRADLADLIRSVDLVMHVCDRPVLDRAEQVQRLCAQTGTPLTQAMVVGDDVWVSPVAVGGPGWVDVWRRLTGLTGVGGQEPPSEPADLADTQVANQLVQDVFRYVTGVRPDHPRPRMARIERGSLRTHQHNFPGPLFGHDVAAEDDDQFVARVTALHTGEPLSVEEFSRRAASLSDSHLGVFGEISEHDFAQLPVQIARTTVADPAGLLGAGAVRPVVTGLGQDFASARYQAALSALATYGCLAVDPRRLLTRDAAPLADADSDPQRELAKIRSGEVVAWVRALRLADSRPLLLPAARAFPALVDPALPYTAPVGVVASYSWQGALEAGLLAHCCSLTIADASAAQAPLPTIDLATAPEDPVLRYCGLMLDAAGQRLTVHDITGPLGVPTCACVLGDEVVACGCGVTMVDALREGLRRTLVCYQSRANNEPEYASPGSIAIPAGLRARAARPVESGPRLDVPSLVATLARRGHVAVVVPLDHDREVHRAVPYLAHVTVIDDQQ